MKPYSKDLRVRMLAAVDSGVRELALAAVTPEVAAGWFAHAGYEPQDQPL
jgi:hypothetical protein